MGCLCGAWRVFSLTERTEFTEVFGAHFEPTEGLRHTENTEASPPTPLRMERGVVCEVTPTGLLAYFVEVFLSQSAQSSRRFLAHISSSQNASGIQSSQSVTANVGTNRGQQLAHIRAIGVSR